MTLWPDCLRAAGRVRGLRPEIDEFTLTYACGKTCNACSNNDDFQLLRRLDVELPGVMIVLHCSTLRISAVTVVAVQSGSILCMVDWMLEVC